MEAESNMKSFDKKLVLEDGIEIRRCAVQNGVTIFTSLDTVCILLDVLEDIVPSVSVIDA